MTSLPVLFIDFRPRRREEHAAVIAIALSKHCKKRFARQFLQRRCRIHQAPIEEHPLAVASMGGCVVVARGCNHATQKRGHVDPRYGLTAGSILGLNHTPPGLLDNDMALPPQFGQQRGFATARTARNYDETIHMVMYLGGN